MAAEQIDTDLREMIDDVLAKKKQKAQERLQIMRALVEKLGSPEAVLSEEFSHIDWQDREINLRGIALRWSEVYQADQQLAQCAKCEGLEDELVADRNCEVPAVAGDGLVEWSECERQQQARDNLRTKTLLGESRVPHRFRRRRLEDWKTHGNQARAKAEQLARDLINSGATRGERGIMLAGPEGTGKTHIAAAVISGLIEEHGVQCYYYTTPDLLGKIRAGIDDNTIEDIVTGLGTARLLVIDDLGKEYVPGNPSGGYVSQAWVQQEIYRIVNRRYEEELPTVITTNMDHRMLTERYGKPLVSRLVEMCHWVVLDLEDYRDRWWEVTGDQGQ